MTKAKTAPPKTRGASGGDPSPKKIDRSEQRRMRELYQAALASRGCIERMIQDMDLPVAVLLQRLSILRSLGVAKTVTLHDPLARGTKHQSTIWVRMASIKPDDIARFEDDIIADPAVANAQRVAGSFDYRLATFHRGWSEAMQWTRALRCRPEVAEVEQIAVRRLFGDDLPGLVLRGRTGVGR